MDIKNIGPGKDVPATVNVVVEIPKGSQNKYEIDKEHGILKLDRVLFSAMSYPGDYGIIPQTLAEDGDPLDAIVLVTNPTYPMTLIEARPIGALKMVDNGEGDDKILCVPVDDPRFAEVKDIHDVRQATLNEVSNFFETYKILEKKKVTISGWKNAAAAKKIINESVARYKKNK